MAFALCTFARDSSGPGPWPPQPHRMTLRGPRLTCLLTGRIRLAAVRAARLAYANTVAPSTAISGKMASYRQAYGKFTIYFAVDYSLPHQETPRLCGNALLDGSIPSGRRMFLSSTAAELAPHYQP